MDIAIFTATFRYVSEAMDRVREWSRTVVGRILAERWSHREGDVPLADYLTRCDTSPAEKERCFRAMLAYFEDGGVRSGA